MFPFIQCQCFDKIRVLFWSQISALGVFFYFDNERMRPLNTKVPDFNHYWLI